MKPLAIIAILMMGCVGEQGVETLSILCGYLIKWFAINIKPQSLQEIINRPQTTNFFQKIMEKIIAHQINKISVKMFRNKCKALSFFNRILLQDSTVISLPKNMWRLFTGCGGSASKAAIKIDITFDLVYNRVLSAKFVPGKVSDAKFSNDILSQLEDNDLVIRDLGYFNLSCFKEIVRHNYFISRLSKSAYVYLNKDGSKPLDLIEYLEKLEIQNGVDINVYIGKLERLPVRLIAIKVPPEVIKARREQFKRNHGRSKEPSQSLSEWNGYTFMITNIPKEKFSLKCILKLYKIRWQIELFFKNMKSNLGVDKIKGKNQHRMMSLIYIKISIVWITTILYAYAQALVDEDQEVSLYKFTSWLKNVGGLRETFLTGDFSNVLNLLESSTHLFCKQYKRKRTTTLKEIENEAAKSNQNVA